MAETTGSQVFNSSQFTGLIGEAINMLGSAGKKLEGIKPPVAELATNFQSMLDEVAGYRGRPLFYRYIGSGLGSGPYVELEDGSVKLDLINGIGVHILGHSHPAVLKGALMGAATDVVIQGNLQPNKEYLHLEAKLSELATRQSRMKHVWFATCGTIANENALKMCRQKRNGAPLIVGFADAFAGRSTMMSELTDNPAYKVGQPRYNEVLRLPFMSHTADAKSKEKTLSILKEYVAKHGDNIGCFTFEPMQGEGGYRYPSRDFLVPLLEFCKEHGIPIWADEVQTFCRTGNFFAFETFDIGKYIDVCTIAKTAQNGATLFTPEMKPDNGLLGGTFSGSGASLAAGLAGLNELDEGGYMGAQGKIAAIHQSFVGMLQSLEKGSCKGMLSDAGGLGLMVAFTPFDGSKEKQLAVAKKFFENGLMAFGCGHDPHRIRFLIPAVLEEKHIQVAKEVIEKSLQELA